MTHVSRQYATTAGIYRWMGEQAQFWSGLTLNAITWALGLVSLLLLDRFVGARWRADRADRRLNDALNLSRIVSNPSESEITRALAQAQLDRMGFTQQWLSAFKQQQLSEAEAVFAAKPAGPEAESPTVQPEQNTFLLGLKREIMALEGRLEAGGRGSRIDVEIRIYLIMWTFIVVFMTLTGANILSAFGWR